MKMGGGKRQLSWVGKNKDKEKRAWSTLVFLFLKEKNSNQSLFYSLGILFDSTYTVIKLN